MDARKALLIPLLALAGCAEGPVLPDPAPLVALRDRFVLDVEPAGAITATAWREQQEAPEGAVELGAEPSDPDRLTLVGVVGGMPSPFDADAEPSFPWKTGSPTFFLVDPEVVAEFADHAGEAGEDHAKECPFCIRRARANLPLVAAVTFGAQQIPENTDAKAAFGLQERDTVVVRGKPVLVGDLLTIEADGLFVRQE